ncbi:Hypothetical protein FKW44_021875, partial [Caligus rogercresseyi]
HSWDFNALWRMDKSFELPEWTSNIGNMLWGSDRESRQSPFVRPNVNSSTTTISPSELATKLSAETINTLLGAIDSAASAFDGFSPGNLQGTTAPFVETTTQNDVQILEGDETDVADVSENGSSNGSNGDGYVETIEYIMTTHESDIETRIVFHKTNEGNCKLHCTVKTDTESLFENADGSEKDIRLLPSIYLVDGQTNCDYLLSEEGEIRVKFIGAIRFAGVVEADISDVLRFDELYGRCVAILIQKDFISISSGSEESSQEDNEENDIMNSIMSESTVSPIDEEPHTTLDDGVIFITVTPPSFIFASSLGSNSNNINNNNHNNNNVDNDDGFSLGGFLESLFPSSPIGTTTNDGGMISDHGDGEYSPSSSSSTSSSNGLPSLPTSFESMFPVTRPSIHYSNNHNHYNNHNNSHYNNHNSNHYNNHYNNPYNDHYNNPSYDNNHYNDDDNNNYYNDHHYDHNNNHYKDPNNNHYDHYNNHYDHYNNHYDHYNNHYDHYNNHYDHYNNHYDHYNNHYDHYNDTHNYYNDNHYYNNHYNNHRNNPFNDHQKYYYYGNSDEEYPSMYFDEISTTTYKPEDYQMFFADDDFIGLDSPAQFISSHTRGKEDPEKRLLLEVEDGFLGISQGVRQRSLMRMDTICFHCPRSLVSWIDAPAGI